MFKSLFAELKRRNVIRVAGVYVVVAWVILQVANNLFPALTLPTWTITFVAVLLLIGFPLTAIIAWAFEITPDGIRRTPAARRSGINDDTRRLDRRRAAARHLRRGRIVRDGTDARTCRGAARRQ